MTRGPFFSSRFRPIFSSIAKIFFISSGADRLVLNNKAWFKKFCWSLFPQGAVLYNEDLWATIPHSASKISIASKKVVFVFPTFPPISRYALFIYYAYSLAFRKIIQWPFGWGFPILRPTRVSPVLPV